MEKRILSPFPKICEEWREKREKETVKLLLPEKCLLDRLFANGESESDGGADGRKGWSLREKRRVGVEKV